MKILRCLPVLANTALRPAHWPFAAAAVSALLLAGAFAFEIFGDYPPCPLCIAQRWAHVWIMMAGIGLGALFRFVPALPGAVQRAGAGAMALPAGYSAWIAGRHAGMEYGFWTIPCQSTDASGLTIESMLEGLSRAQNVVLCDEAPWTLLGVSMAGYNTLISAALCVISLFVMIRPGAGGRND